MQHSFVCMYAAVYLACRPGSGAALPHVHESRLPAHAHAISSRASLHGLTHPYSNSVLCLYCARAASTTPHGLADITIGGVPAGRVKFELWADLCPKTAENFRQLCTGEFRQGGEGRVEVRACGRASGSCASGSLGAVR
eukprot:257138-Chlamydomonas_euryale.AAC.7